MHCKSIWLTTCATFLVAMSLTGTREARAQSAYGDSVNSTYGTPSVTARSNARRSYTWGEYYRANAEHSISNSQDSFPYSPADGRYARRSSDRPGPQQRPVVRNDRAGSPGSGGILSQNRAAPRKPLARTRGKENPNDPAGWISVFQGLGTGNPGLPSDLSRELDGSAAAQMPADTSPAPTTPFPAAHGGDTGAAADHAGSLRGAGPPSNVNSPLEGVPSFHGEADAQQTKLPPLPGNGNPNR
jgi:hypothetical protein